MTCGAVSPDVLRWANERPGPHAEDLAGWFAKLAEWKSGEQSTRITIGH